MKIITERDSRPTLESVLRRAHLSVALIAVIMAGLTIMIAGLIAMRIYSEQNLILVARSMSYTVEAAVVFNDATTAQEALALIAKNEDIDEVRLTDIHGKLLTRWKRGEPGTRYLLEQTLGELILPEPLLFPITHNDVVIGHIRLTPHGRNLLHFLLSGLLCVLICLALSITIALRFANRMQAGIIGPMRDLAEIAHRVRRERSFELRVPSAEIAELNELNHDFNALLDELEAWQIHLKREHEGLTHRANHDSLTGLPNRAFLVGELDMAIADARQNKTRIAVMFIDCDLFKQINDKHGHASGDSVLIEIASRIKGQLRGEDLVARLGGDEFAILLKSLHHNNDAFHIADRIIFEMNTPIELPTGRSIVTSLTIGIAKFPEHGDDPVSILAAADKAMYSAKKIHRGTRQLAEQPALSS
ncbi:diguanylate cyclase domain-containing protein [Glaciimonas sp. PCH181]|uniref:diguanylate cyclase domain-containing protein n=1 Tax=Glaciimonas sp. PCH181 TaxID=2133943 RepID=UPI000D3B85B8|nr:diguanylate cyclase [Glaciimonas sp. PCH181]PUA17108.1 diguanylate cyclase [Glaciimonas sp. PCH181]